MRDHHYSQPHEHEEDCDCQPSQAEIVEVISFANNYEILDLLTDASELLCEKLNFGDGVEYSAIYRAQKKLCRYSPVFKVIARAYAACGVLDDDVEWMFYDGLKPSFMKAALFEVSEIRDKRIQARGQKGKARRRYNFQLEDCRPFHDKDFCPDRGDAAEAMMKKEAV